MPSLNDIRTEQRNLLFPVRFNNETFIGSVYVTEEYREISRKSLLGKDRVVYGWVVVSYSNTPPQ